MSYTSDQHEWARKAAEGDIEHTGFYRISSDRAGLEGSARRRNVSSHIAPMRDGRWVSTLEQSSQWQLN